MGFFNKIKQGLQKTRASLSNSVNSIINSFTKIDEDLFEELEEILVMADIGVTTATEICNILRKKIKEQGIKDPTVIKELLKEIIADMVNGDSELHLETSPSIILVIGVNGVGKTTTIGKLSAQLKAEGKNVVLGAADTFRAAAIDQLGIWAERAGVTMVKSVEGTDPASVVFDTIASAKSKGADVIICDTAGRLHNKKNLMDELAKIYRVIGRELPDASLETLLVLDAATGQNAVNQAREFKNVADITGIVLTKLDGTAKGGIVIPIRNELSIPVKYIGVGEGIDDLQPFNAQEFVDGIFENGEEK
ncbi:MAG: signal recognition particle-docking protein FtsY [Clostridia bacterium]|nr:signal recognition particle-docking protein FtsY [Clostridia bacterium]